MNDAAIDGLVRGFLARLSAGARVPHPALILLIRQFILTGDDEIRAALESALAEAFDEEDAVETDAGRLRLCAAVEAISDDERLQPTAVRLASRVRGGWPDRRPFHLAMRGLEAYLEAQPLVDDPGGLAPAIDELERLVGRAYEPGAGVVAGVSTHPVRDHAAAANALLMAFDITGRLPYAMLAEELTQHVLRPQARPSPIDTVPGAGTGDLAAGCELARACTQLSNLYADPAYRAAAVTLDGARYAEDAERMLSAMAPFAAADEQGAIFGLALGEWLARTV